MQGTGSYRSIQAARRDHLGRVGRARNQVRDGRRVVAAERAAERLGDPLARGLPAEEGGWVGKFSRVATRECRM